MSYLYDSTGTLVVIDPPAGAHYEPAFFSITTGWPPSSITGSAFITHGKLISKINYVVKKTLNNKLYYQQMGKDYEPMPVRGVCFNPDAQFAGTDTSTGLNLIMTYFDSYGAAAPITSGDKIEITAGDQTITGLLVAAQVEFHIEGHCAPIFDFAFTILPVSIT